MSGARSGWFIVAVALVAACSGGSGGSTDPKPPIGGRSDTIVASGSSGSNNGFGNSSGGQYYFSPAPDTVPIGTTVTFHFLDVLHTVTFDQAPAGISDIAATRGADSTRTFSAHGTYSWHCSIHPYMHGVVVVP
jgi:plastocyanin